jgi:hypothetical protein
MMTVTGVTKPLEYRHCERSEAIQFWRAAWIASSLRFSQ